VFLTQISFGAFHPWGFFHHLGPLKLGGGKFLELITRVVLYIGKIAVSWEKSVFKKNPGAL